MAEDKRTYLTQKETSQISEWLLKNNCDVSRGDIILRYDFWIFGAGVALEYISEGRAISIEIREDESNLAEEEKTVNSLPVGNWTTPLVLSPDAHSKYIALAQQNVAGHFAEESEWPGFSLSYHFSKAGCQIFAGSCEIESIQFN